MSSGARFTSGPSCGDDTEAAHVIAALHRGDVGADGVPVGRELAGNRKRIGLPIEVDGGLPGGSGLLEQLRMRCSVCVPTSTST